ncbi:D-alanine--D-alanyl carrier protein ligase [Streptomyces antimycoticus]
MPDNRADLPLTDAQLGVWLAERGGFGEPGAYQWAEYLELDGPVAVDLLARAVARTAADCEAVNVRITAAGSEAPVQRLVTDAGHVVETVDLRTAPDPDAAALTWTRAAMAGAGGCDAGPLFLGAALRVSDDRTLLFHRVHHIALDGAGMALFAERVAEVWPLSEGSQVPPSGWSGLRTLVDTEKEYRGSAEHDADGDRWRKRLAASPHFPTLGAEPAAVSRPSCAPAGACRRRSSPEHTVALLLERSVDLVVAAVAVVRAGAAYLPLHRDDASPRQQTILSDTDTRLLVTDRHTRDDAVVRYARDRGLRLLDVRAGSDAAAGDAPPGAGVSPDSLACVMFTSGSTGRPKGVGISQGALASLAADRSWSEGGAEKVLLHSPHAFDAFNLELWVPLLTGGEVVVAAPGHLGPAELARTVAETGVTGLWLTAGLFHAIAAEDPACLAGLRQVWTGGDAVSPDAVRAVRRALPHLTVVNGYGPTETTVFATRYAVRRLPADAVSVPVGGPLDGKRVLLLDDALRPVPPGVVGEVYLGEWGWRAATSGARARPRSASSPTRRVRRGRASTARVTWPGGARTAGWSSPAVPTDRSSCAATGSRRARSTPPCAPIRGSGRR